MFNMGIEFGTDDQVVTESAQVGMPSIAGKADEAGISTHADTCITESAVEPQIHTENRVQGVH
jgi:hypothetical protein